MKTLIFFVVVVVVQLLLPVSTERKPLFDRWGIEAKASWRKEMVKCLNYSREPKNLSQLFQKEIPAEILPTHYKQFFFSNCPGSRVSEALKALLCGYI